MLESYDLRQALVYLWTDSTKFPAKYQRTTLFKVANIFWVNNTLVFIANNYPYCLQPYLHWDPGNRTVTNIRLYLIILSPPLREYTLQFKANTSFAWCPKLNICIISHSQTTTNAKRSLLFKANNSLAWSLKLNIRGVSQIYLRNIRSTSDPEPWL